MSAYPGGGWFRDSLRPAPRRRMGSGLVLSLLIHLMVLGGVLYFMPSAGIPGKPPRERAAGHQPLPGPAPPRTERTVSPGKSPQPARLRGRLAVRGMSAAGFRVEARRAADGRVAASTVLDPRGRFLLPLLDRGVYELRLTHEGRVISRLRVRLRSGRMLHLEWDADLRVRISKAEGKTLPEPEAFWRLFRRAENNEWRRNLERLLTRSGVSREELFARRRGEKLWRRCRDFMGRLLRRLAATTQRIRSWMAGDNRGGRCGCNETIHSVMRHNSDIHE